MLLAADQAVADAGRVQAVPQRGFDLADQVVAVAAGPAQGLVQHPAAQRIQRHEAQFLQFAAQLVHAQAIGDRGVDVQGFAGDAPPLVGRQVAQRAHVVQAVGQLDQHHPQVAGHRQHHLAKVRRLRLLAGVEANLRQLGDGIHQRGHFLAELLGDLRAGGGGVLDDVVQQRRAQRVAVDVQVGEDFGHRQRVGDVGLAGLALLAQMGLRAEGMGAPHGGDVVRRQVGS